MSEHDHHHDHVEDEIDASAWFSSIRRLTCPACGAAGALSLGGGVFCPTCGETTTNPGFHARPPRDQAEEPEPR
jgi:uncharacterized Zn finger protein (UPF0148 family)